MISDIDLLTRRWFTEDEVQSFLKMHPHKERPIGYEFSRADVEAIDAMFFRTHDAGQLLAVWCLAYISQFGEV